MSTASRDFRIGAVGMFRDDQTERGSPTRGARGVAAELAIHRLLMPPQNLRAVRSFSFLLIVYSIEV